MAYQHTCLAQGTWLCRRDAPGKPKTKVCPRCGGRWTLAEGRYALLPWRGDGRYTAEQAIVIRDSYAAAERHVTNGDTQCVRFLVGA